MASLSQRKASNAHRRRAVVRGLVRMEIQATKGDAGLIRAVAKALQSDKTRANALRATLEEALADPEVRTAFDVFGSDLPDEVFADVFDQPRGQDWRPVDL